MNMFIVYLTVIIFLVIVMMRIRGKGLNLPPGPRGLPIVGYLPWLDAEAPHESLTTLSRKYGPICGLWMGSIYTVLLSEPRLVRQVLAMDNFSGRAPLYLTHGIMKGYDTFIQEQRRLVRSLHSNDVVSTDNEKRGTHKNQTSRSMSSKSLYKMLNETQPMHQEARFEDDQAGLICAEGEQWKEQRKFATTTLKNLGMVKFGAKRDKMEEKVLQSVTELIVKLKERSNDLGIDPIEIIHHCVGNLMNNLVFGRVYDEDDDTWKWLRFLQEDGVKHIGIAGPLNFLPFLRHFPRFSKLMNFLIDGKMKTHKIYKELIDDYEEKRENNDNLLAAFNNEMRKRSENGDDLGSFNEQQYYHLLADIFGAGTDTSLTTIRWFLLFMAVHPEQQEKIYQEIFDIVGNRKIHLNDRPLLVHLEAAICEVQRLRSVVPLGIPHGSFKNGKIRGFDIPKNAMIVPLLWAIHMDPELWENPGEFRIERFINSQGSLGQPEAFLPYQTGKRVCIGDELAKIILFLFTGRILQTFKVSIPKGDKADLKGECGITLIPKPHKLVFSLRSE